MTGLFAAGCDSQDTKMAKVPLQMCLGADTRYFIHKTTSAIGTLIDEETGCSKRLGTLPEATGPGRTSFHNEVYLAFPCARLSDQLLSPVPLQQCPLLCLPVGYGAFKTHVTVQVFFLLHLFIVSVLPGYMALRF